jgi:PIN domain nuclease of toxin-antitoxin system
MSVTSEGTLVLDTHVWIWLLEDERGRFGKEARRLVRERAGSGELGVAAISVWEVALLESQRRIVLSMEIGQWVREGLASKGVSLIPLLPAIAIESTRLPSVLHRDPADRILVATARVLRATLVTADRLLLDYAAGGNLRALAADV